MPPLRSDTVFLLLLVAILLAALAVTGMQTSAPPALASLPVPATATPTATPTPDWWTAVAFATPTLSGLPVLPKLSLDGGGRLGGSGGGGGGPVPFQTLACPGPARITAITRNGVWWLVEGTATVENFWYWKMELSPDGSSWTTLYRQESPVSGGRLMEFNTTTVPRGQYRLRLIAVKRDGNYPGPCETVVSL
jgi:hypothetical protein